MSSQDQKREEIMIDKLIFFFLSILSEVSKKICRLNVLPLHQTRTELGKFGVLVQKLQQMDWEKYIIYFWVTDTRFNDLIH